MCLCRPVSAKLRRLEWIALPRQEPGCKVWSEPDAKSGCKIWGGIEYSPTERMTSSCIYLFRLQISGFPLQILRHEPDTDSVGICLLFSRLLRLFGPCRSENLVSSQAMAARGSVGTQRKSTRSLSERKNVGLTTTQGWHKESKVGTGDEQGGF
ncbi:uncharacterized protein UTRI_03860 [Ustilago trichophora]|uniref:Uncharacterized protein n=1 Tax=Ustilago trichophora TaxID=86804 RepID=A0A5C3E579_9BASI|nr:uncharacterized protein UTRI_03860 [Ustilago trichophora]